VRPRRLGGRGRDARPAGRKPQFRRRHPLRQATLQVPLKTGFAPQFTDPGWDERADALPQLEASVAKHDPRWSAPLAPPRDGEGDHLQGGGGGEGEGDSAQAERGEGA
jgi:hypothetical protein